MNNTSSAKTDAYSTGAWKTYMLSEVSAALMHDDVIDKVVARPN